MEYSPVHPARVEETSDWLADEVGVGGPVVSGVRREAAGSAVAQGLH